MTMQQGPAALAAGVVVGLVMLVAVLAGAAATGLSAVLGGAGAGSGPAAPTGATAGIPADYLLLYEQAAASCPGLSWSVLAAIGTIESGNGANEGPSAAGAVGPMQFEPTTFAEYDMPVPPGGVSPPSPYDPVDAIYAAARDLCANGARDNANLPAAIFNYNHSDTYVTEVLALAARYAAAG
ncbi:MAG TPA: lytic transglycosylase domain-containing protein [Mycobacteriales bacterium]|nr:lytic transglycosylase domain-containing protein [Mycobacteriales bacterium]